MRGIGPGLGFLRPSGGGGGGAPAPFDPLQLSPVWQFDAIAGPGSPNADGTGGTTAIGAQSRFIPDTGAKGNSVSHANVVNAPTRGASGDEWTFDGNDIPSRATLANAETYAGAFTFALVARTSTATANQCFGAAGAVVRMNRGAADNGVSMSRGSTVSSTAAPDTGSRVIIVAVCNGTTTDVYVNGRLIASGNAGTAVINQVRMGATEANGNILTGAISYFGGFPSAVAGAQLFDLHAYLSGRFGVALTTRVSYTPTTIAAGRVLCLGDSLTVGFNGTDNTSGAYRAPWFGLAFGAGKTLLPVGPTANGPALVGGQTFPAEHAGVSGERVDQLTARLAALLTAHTPNGLFVLGGMNDANQGVAGSLRQLVRGRVNALLNTARGYSQTMPIFYALVPPSVSNGALETKITEANLGILDALTDQRNIGRPVAEPIDLNTGAVADGYTTTDGIHPPAGAAGFDILGARVHAAVSPFLP